MIPKPRAKVVDAVDDPFGKIYTAEVIMLTTKADLTCSAKSVPECSSACQVSSYLHRINDES